MSRDFTLTKYRELCRALIASGYESMTVTDYLACLEKPARLAILRHDVDRKPGNALKVAGLEADLGLRATYYFRYSRSLFKHDVIQKIAGMGHEIGYHYETLDKSKGDYDKAIGMFRDELSEFRKIARVETICMHGNPLTKWDNRDLWKRYDFREFALVGEAYLSFDASKTTYLSDTGRAWGGRHKVKDLLPGACASGCVMMLSSTDDVTGFVLRAHPAVCYILTHPERWNENPVDWTLSLVSDVAVNVAKTVLGYGSRRLADKQYASARQRGSVSK